MCKLTLRYCPACGENSFKPHDVKAFQCSRCGFLYYHNVAATSSAIIEVGNEILMVYRAHEPCKGTLDFPGGFVEKGERAEIALIREVSEELGIELESTGSYLSNFTNEYHYADVEYQTLDLYFLVRLSNKPAIKPADDVAAYEWLDVNKVDNNEIGFESVKNALAFYKKYKKENV